MNRILASLLLVLATLLGHAQGSMNIYQTNGSILQIALSSIDSVTYTVTPPPLMRIHQAGGSILSLAIAQIDSITYSTGGAPGTAQVATLPATAVGSTTAVVAGTVSDDGGAAVTARGICYGTNPLPTLGGPSVSAGAGLGSYQVQLSGLQPNTLYYARAYATNGQGTAYGNMVAFSTGFDPGGGVLPTVVTIEPGSVSSYGAVTGGQVSSDGGNTVVARGVVWGTGPNPTLANSFTVNGAGMGSFGSSLTNLQASTSYFVRAYATNGNGTAYGGTYQITTLPATVAGVSTDEVNGITANSATVTGTVVHEGGAQVTDRGFCWSSSPNPTLQSNQGAVSVGSGQGIFISTLGNLDEGLVYFVRSYATNNVGTTYGDEVWFTQGGWSTGFYIPGSGVTDQNNITYATILLSNGQEWMAENLRSTTYANGDPIPNVTDNTAWTQLTTGAWAHFNNDSQYETPYGKLYNWYAVADPRNVCPAGWHVPTEEEWQQMELTLGIPASELQDGPSAGRGATENVGGKMKSSGTQHWSPPNLDATNQSGLSFLPAASRSTSGGFSSTLGSQNRIWSATETSTNTAIYRSLANNVNGVGRSSGLNKVGGNSVRCMKD
jgi:uncharacterized protein (TIGR02145 family)